MRTTFVRMLAFTAAILASSAGQLAEINAEDLEKKREGRYFTGAPLIAFSNDTGLGYGLGIYWFYNGAETDPGFRRAPYFTRIYAQYFASSRGLLYHTLTVDMPFVAGSKYRLRAQALYEADINRNYFGLGAAAHRPLPADDFGDYQHALDDDTPAGPGSTSAAFNRYEITNPALTISVERSIRPEVKGLIGFGLNRAAVRTFDGRSISFREETRTQGDTLLSIDSPTGFGGGWANYVKAGFAYDTRDFEPAPKRGWFADVTAELSHPAIGSRFKYSRQTVTVRGYRTVFRRMVFAGRTAFSVFQGDPPFFTMATLGFYDSRPGGLGGGSSIRGYRDRRFAGRAMALTNAEMRYDVFEHVRKGQRFLYTLVAFADGGRVFDGGTEITLHDWKAAAGGGLRFAWNQATILSATYGRSGEDSNLVIGVGHLF